MSCEYQDQCEFYTRFHPIKGYCDVVTEEIKNTCSLYAKIGKTNSQEPKTLGALEVLIEKKEL